MTEQTGTRDRAIRAAFEADNFHATYTDAQYQQEVADGRTWYLERIVDAVIAEVEKSK